MHIRRFNLVRSHGSGPLAARKKEKKPPDVDWLASNRPTALGPGRQKKWPVALDSQKRSTASWQKNGRRGAVFHNASLRLSQFTINLVLKWAL